MSHLVSKEKIGKNGEYNLSGDRYKEIEIYNGSYPMVELGEVINLDFGVRITKKDNEGKKYPVYGGGGESFRTNTYNREDEYVISRFAMSEYCVRYVRDKFFMLDSGFTFSLKEKYENQADKNYIGLILMNKQDIVYRCARGHAQKNLDTNQFKQIKIPLPPIEVQKKIVEEIENYQKIIDGAKMVVENYKPRIEIEKNWEIKELGDVCIKLFAGGDAPKEMSKEKTEEFTIPIYSNGIEEKSLYGYTNYSKVNEDAVTISGRGTIGYTQIRRAPFVPIVRLIVAIPNKTEMNLVYLKNILDSIDIIGNGNSIPQLTIPMIKNKKIAVPPLNIQQQIVKEIEKEQELVNANKELIKIFENKIESVINKVWEG